ncbi:MAG: ROK family protein, partial [Chloroflexota bacterium]|nr:ROK family protein [Chloroflexota bacterium]
IITMKKKNITLAIDVGGTQMRVAAFPIDQTDPIRQKRMKTYADGETSLQRLIQLIQSIKDDDEIIDAIGIAAPGPLDPKTGIILAAPNLPEWNGVSITDLVHDEIGAPAYLGNDANLAAVGEWRYGAGQGHHHLIYLTISTGIGGGVICDDHLLLGWHGLGAELGHTIILPDGPMCGCGQRGHVEAISSGTGIAKYVAEQLADGRKSILNGKPDAKAISQAAKQGDELAKETFERAGYYLGLALSNFLAIFNPSIIIFGGGVSQAGDLLFEPMNKAMQETVLSEHYLEDLIITQAALGDNAGLYGALALARGVLPKS